MRKRLQEVTPAKLHPVCGAVAVSVDVGYPQASLLESVAYMVALGRWRASAIAMAPLPVPTSAIATFRSVMLAAQSSAVSTSSSVSWRGIKTLLST